MSLSQARSILIVDDDLPLLESLVEVFELEEWKVLRASSVQEARQVLAGERVDVILTDVRMPGEGGQELASTVRDLKAQQKKLSLYFMTGFSDFPESVLLSLGAKAVFHKPFDLHQVLLQLKTDTA